MILVAMVVVCLPERLVCQLHQLKLATWSGSSHSLSNSLKAPKVACAQECLLGIGRDLSREFSETKCLEGDKLFAFDVAEAQRSVRNWGFGQHSKVNTCGQVWQLLGLCGANTTLAAGTEAAGGAKALQRA